MAPSIPPIIGADSPKSVRPTGPSVNLARISLSKRLILRFRR